jgi:hypothetical protein
MKQNRWTEAEEIIAKDLFAAEASGEEFVTRLGRTKSAAHSHFYYGRCCSGIKRRGYHRGNNRNTRITNRVGPAGGASARVSERPTDTMLLEAKIRMETPRSITQFVCGDPAPGYSALDRK